MFVVLLIVVIVSVIVISSDGSTSSSSSVNGSIVVGVVVVVKVVIVVIVEAVVVVKRTCGFLHLQETLGSPEEVELQPGSSISALRRSFLEGGTGGAAGPTEWEKRMAASPLRRLEDSPMIEPLETEEVKFLHSRPLLVCNYSPAWQLIG